MGLVHARNLVAVPGVRVRVASTRGVTVPGAEHTYRSYSDALSDREVDAVMISTPYPTHPALIADAAAAGKHIFSEKPLGHTVKDIMPAYDAVRKSKSRFMTGFMRRWDPAYKRAKSLVDTPHVGLPIVLKCTSGDPEYPEKYSRASPADAMYRDLAVHDVDLARWLLHSEVSSVYTTSEAMSYSRLRELGDVDTAVAVLNMKSGAKALLHLSRALSYGYNVTSELVGKDGTLRIGDTRLTDMQCMSAKRSTTDIAWDFTERFRDAFQYQVEAFVRLVRARTDDDVEELLASDSSYSSFEDGIAATNVAEALCRSASTGLPADVSTVALP